MFDRVVVPTPFQMGAVNTYVAGETVVDPGPSSEPAWEQLVDALNDRGLAPADVSQVLITHPHPDHFGQAARLEQTGATVYGRPEAFEIYTDFAGRFSFEQSFFIPFLQRHGISEETARSVTELPSAFLEYVEAIEEPQPLTDGDTVTVDGETVRARAVEGHAIGELLFEYDGRSIVGDHVLGKTTPNPFLQPPREDGADRPRVLPQYNRSLETLTEVGYDRLLTGHGDPIEAPTERIREILDHHEERTTNVRELVADGEPITAAELMYGLFDDLPVIEYFPAMSEAIGHLDVLEERGEVTASESDGIVHYELA